MTRKKQPKIGDIEVFHSEAIYGARTKQALVKINFRSEETILTVSDAKRVAFDLLDVCHAADGDAFLMDWLQTRLDVQESQAAQILLEFRTHRIRKNGEH